MSPAYTPDRGDLFRSRAFRGASPQQGGLNAEAWAEGQGYAGQGCLGKPEAIEDEQDRGGRHISAFPQYRYGGFDRAGG